MARQSAVPSGFVAWSPGRKHSPGWVEDARGCHIWSGATSTNGYGQVGIGGRTQYIHRVRYEREVGPIPAGMDLDHVCDNGSGGCCNPRHCRPVSRRENLLRGNTVTSHHLAQTHCLRGHELSGGNLYTYANGDRACRACRAAAMRRFYTRHPDYKRIRRMAADVELEARAA